LTNQVSSLQKVQDRQSDTEKRDIFIKNIMLQPDRLHPAFKQANIRFRTSPYYQDQKTARPKNHFLMPSKTGFTYLFTNSITIDY